MHGGRGVFIPLSVNPHLRRGRNNDGRVTLTTRGFRDTAAGGCVRVRVIMVILLYVYEWVYTCHGRPRPKNPHAISASTRQCIISFAIVLNTYIAEQVRVRRFVYALRDYGRNDAMTVHPQSFVCYIHNPVYTGCFTNV